MSVRMLSARKDEEGEDGGGGGSVDFRCGVAVSPVVDWKFYGELNFIVYVMSPPNENAHRFSREFLFRALPWSSVRERERLHQEQPVGEGAVSDE